jgi:hypothetical protein
MKFNIGELPPGVLSPVAVGNVYPAQGNRPTVAWVVVSVRTGRVTVLGIDAEGQVCSGQTYAEHAMSDRPLIGRCAGVQDMSLDIEWYGESRRFRA